MYISMFGRLGSTPVIINSGWKGHLLDGFFAPKWYIKKSKNKINIYNNNNNDDLCCNCTETETKLPISNIPYSINRKDLSMPQKSKTINDVVNNFGLNILEKFKNK